MFLPNLRFVLRIPILCEDFVDQIMQFVFYILSLIVESYFMNCLYYSLIWQRKPSADLDIVRTDELEQQKVSVHFLKELETKLAQSVEPLDYY